MSCQPVISGIICTHNRERFIKRCILSLLNQSLPPDQYEIIVVDNGSTDRTADICHAFERFPNFVYVHEPLIGLSQARNAGWRHARGRYVGYLDDDAIAVETWLESALWSFENVSPSPEWVGGPIDLEWEAAAPDWIDDGCRTTLGWVNWGKQARFLDINTERLGGGNSFYRKTVLQDMHGFDTRLGRKHSLLLSGEETQLQHKIKSVGGRLYYHPGIRIFHFVPKARMKPRFFYNRYYWGGITDVIIARTVDKTGFVPIGGETGHNSKLARLALNLLHAMGLGGDRGQTIQGRIYLAYVFGTISAYLRKRSLFGHTGNLA